MRIAQPCTRPWGLPRPSTLSSSQQLKTGQKQQGRLCFVFLPPHFSSFCFAIWTISRIQFSEAKKKKESHVDHDLKTIMYFKGKKSRKDVNFRKSNCFRWHYHVLRKRPPSCLRKTLHANYVTINDEHKQCDSGAASSTADPKPHEILTFST